MKNSAKTTLITKIGIISARNTGTIMVDDTEDNQSWHQAPKEMIQHRKCDD